MSAKIPHYPEKHPTMLQEVTMFMKLAGCGKMEY